MFPRVAIDDARARPSDRGAGAARPTLRCTALIVAAAAERAGLVLLHDDDAFDEIAAVTGQPTERAVPRRDGGPAAGRASVQSASESSPTT